MGKYVLRRILMTIPVLWGVGTATFFMVHILPGDPVLALLGSEDIVDPAQVEALRTELGLNKPLPQRYVEFLANAARGELGDSLRSQRPVIDQLLEAFPSTIQLAVCALLVAVTFGVTMGVLAAMKHKTIFDNLTMLVAVVGVGCPSFFVGILLIYLFSVKLGVLPATGQGGLTAVILPAVTLGFSSAAILARLTRSSMLEVMRQDYISTARAKGLANRRVIINHALRNSLIPVVTTMGIQLGNLLSGGIIIETVFARAGIGRLLITAINQKDGPMIQGSILFTAIIFVLVNLIVDLSYGFLDPRIKHS